jgi:ABC-type enterochelin transport system substrate-binding protein
MSKSRYILIFVVSLVLAGSANIAGAQKGCINKDVSGGYGFIVTGVNTTVQANFAMSGMFIADGNGNFAGKGTESTAGVVYPLIFEGTYTVDSLCTGTAIFKFQNGDQVKLAFTLVENGSELFIIDADNGTVETGTAKKQFTEHR